MSQVQGGAWHLPSLSLLFTSDSFIALLEDAYSCISGSPGTDALGPSIFNIRVDAAAIPVPPLLMSNHRSLCTMRT